MRKLLLFTLFCNAMLVVLSQEKYRLGPSAWESVHDSSFLVLTRAADPAVWEQPGPVLSRFFSATHPQQKVLLFTAKNQPVEVWSFPGLSDKKALVIGGMHGSELSSVEVARELIRQLQGGKKPYYNVLIIPVLFPDNANAAENSGAGRLQENTGRYSNEKTADPNRQMPFPGRPLLAQQPQDAMGREVEKEIRALLALIQAYKPHRLLSIHAIRDPRRAGVFADPRTDCDGLALGFDHDAELALLMAEHIQAFGGACPGNRLDSLPTALYYLDPEIAAPGQKQARSFQTASLKGKSRGVSMGTWCSTAVCHEDASLNRPAIRTLTMEFPGYYKPAEYKTVQEQQQCRRMIAVYAASIRHYFLHSFFVENESLVVGNGLAAN